MIEQASLPRQKGPDIFYPPIAGYAVVSLAVIALAIMQRRGGLSRNLAIGIRTKHTLASDQAWSSAQASAIPYLIATAIIAGSHAVALLTVQLSGYSETLGHVLAVSGFLIIVAIALLSMRAANRAAKSSG